MKTPKTNILSTLLTVISYNRITQFGASLIIVSSLLILIFGIMGTVGAVETTYLGIFIFLIFPTFFLLGLVMVPIGALYERRRPRRDEAEPTQPYPVWDFNRDQTRRGAVLIVLISVALLTVAATLGFNGVKYAGTTEFCGTTCHSVMEPEYTAYLDSPHANVACVNCHIGPGATWFARSKISGVRQVFATALNTYSRPIPHPVHHLRPARETCEQCHAPDKFSGDRLRVIKRYGEDEANTQMSTVLLMHIGGGYDDGAGIHNWHIAKDKTTTYLATDEHRQKIEVVRVTNSDGTVTEYRSSELTVSETEIADAEFRTMDCIDCHNRPSHTFKMPAPVMDELIAKELVDPSLPYIKMLGVQVLTEIEGTENDLENIEDQIRAFYTEKYPQLLADKPDTIETAIKEIQTAYSRNVFPKMNVTWGEYPNNIGHVDSAGCFRCHDDTHESKNGDMIRQDCTICHSVLAWEEENPDIMEVLGL